MSDNTLAGTATAPPVGMPEGTSLTAGGNGLADRISPNPLRTGLQTSRNPEPCVIVIFGVTGDLTARKLMPALYDLAVELPLPEGFSIVGVSHRDWSQDDFRAEMRQAIVKGARRPVDDDGWDLFAQGMFYVRGDFRADETFNSLGKTLDQIDQERGTHGNRLFYLATAPNFYADIIAGLGRTGVAELQDRFASEESGWHRVVVEKPFGHDLASARELIREMESVFNERQIYRIDHYLGKETVQNVLAFRFANGIFEPLWNRRYVNHVQITAAESIGVEGRGAYYQESGALRDMIQNHLLQVMATMAMEPSATFESNAVRDERAKLLRSIRILKEDEVATNAVKGQYGPGRVGGNDLPGFRQEQGVDPEAQTDTYAAVTFFVDNWRWAGIPFYIRTGKRLPKRVTDIAIHFNAAPLALFDKGNHVGPQPNLLIIRIQPEEGISLRFLSKTPGGGMALRPVSMDFNYGSSFGVRTPTAYETLLMDAMSGDATLYTRQDMVDASWQVVQPILNFWASKKFNLPNYEAGAWGPKESDEMLARRGHVWRVP
jgi:glucose-6-phosphate 1-dehydrogenase